VVIGIYVYSWQWHLIFQKLKSNDDFTDPESMQIIQRYTHFMKDVLVYKLQDVHDLKPILDGKKIAGVLGIKPGPQMGRLLNQLIEWQVSVGDVTEDEAIQWVKHHFYNDNK